MEFPFQKSFFFTCQRIERNQLWVRTIRNLTQVREVVFCSWEFCSSSPKTNMKKEKFWEGLLVHWEECFENCQADLLQQHGAPCHVARLMSDNLDFCGKDNVKDWPGSSPTSVPLRTSRSSSEADYASVWDNLNPHMLKNVDHSSQNELKTNLLVKMLVSPQWLPFFIEQILFP